MLGALSGPLAVQGVPSLRGSCPPSGTGPRGRTEVDPARAGHHFPQIRSAQSSLLPLCCLFLIATASSGVRSLPACSVASSSARSASISQGFAQLDAIAPLLVHKQRVWLL